MNGCLYIVATPIGHLADLSQRAIDTLRGVDAILAEDTRQSAVLLRAHGIETRCEAVHEHNETALAARIVERLQNGASLALISDAGTPLISDPGYRLVAAARAAGIQVSPIPGACALIAALSASGLPTDRFCFEGFLPAKSGERRAALLALKNEPRTLVFYESPHRLVETLADAVDALGADRSATLARELTKRFETILTLPLGELADRVARDADQQRGECVLIMAGATRRDSEALALGQRLYAELIKELPPSRAAKVAAQFAGVAKRSLYGGETSD